MTANLELCKELYELSGWQTPDFENDFGTDWGCPKYNLGYLLRRLPDYSKICKETEGYYADAHGMIEPTKANTPEDALTKLAISLFKSGALKKESSE